MAILAMILGTIWFLGVVTGSTWGGFIHLLLVAAVAVVLIQLVKVRLASEGTASGKKKS